MNKTLLILILSTLLFGCTSKKQLTYLQDINKGSEKEFYAKTKESYKIQNDDIIYVRIISLNQEINELYNINSTQNSQQAFQNDPNTFINGFIVDNEGNIELPIIGKINILNKTIEEAKAEIAKAALVFLKKPTIIVKLINFKFTVLGEVKRPGIYKNYNNQLTILEAIGMAGDITDHGDRKNILVLRPTKEGTHTFRFNLTKKRILTSDAFFLMPNDVVYVEPKNSKTFQLNAPSISLFLSTITTLILILNFVNK